MKTHLGARVPSTMMVAPMSERFVQAIERFVATERVDLVTFEKGQRKDDLAQEYLARFTGEEGVLFVGQAQEKASVFRTEKRTDAQGVKYPWIIRSTAMPNHYYVYILDRDFGPLFIKLAQLQGREPATYRAGAMTYDPRRLRLHGLIARVPRSHRYRITSTGAQVAMLYARLYTRALRPASSLQASRFVRAQRAFDRLDAALADFLKEVKLAA